MLIVSVTVTAVALVGLLVSLWHGSQLGRWICKPVASAGFVGTALAVGCWQSIYGTLVLVALGLGLAGDVLLIPKSRQTFVAGLAFFLLGHVAYAVAFGCRGADSSVVAGSLVGAALPAAWVIRWLWPHLPESMRGPAGSYVVVITTMVSLGVGTFAAVPSWLVLGGALLFYASDLAVARERFVKASFVNRLISLPLYYVAQTLLALSAGM